MLLLLYCGSNRVPFPKNLIEIHGIFAIWNEYLNLMENEKKVMNGIVKSVEKKNQGC